MSNTLRKEINTGAEEHDGETENNVKKPKKPKKRLFSQKQKDMASGYLFISPFYLLFAVFGVFPILFSFYLAFFRWDGLGEMEFVGLNNFNIIFNDPLFWKSLYNTIIIGLMGTAPQLIAALLLAFALNSVLIKYKSVFRLAVFLPYVTSIVAVAIIFSVIFSNQESGLVNSFLGVFGIDPITWTRSEWGAKVAISAMIFWRWVGYNTIIYLAGMQAIPNDLYEAAKIDGATLRQQIWHITIPMLKPFIIFTVLQRQSGHCRFSQSRIFSRDEAVVRKVSVSFFIFTGRPSEATSSELLRLQRLFSSLLLSYFQQQTCFSLTESDVPAR
jgi:cellobiose transport system permease protein